MSSPARTAVLTGVGRRRGIAAALAVGLAEDGWNLVRPVLPCDRLRRDGVSLRAQNLGSESIDTSTPTGLPLFTIMAGLAEMELAGFSVVASVSAFRSRQ